MARKSIVSQNYPRENGLLNDADLRPHTKTISPEELRDIVLNAIANANRKSGRKILNIPDGASDAEVATKYKKSGADLFAYFLRYCGDPASTAHQCNRRHYSDVAREQFRNRTLQKERMNSGWRYQFIARDAAIQSHRFHSVSDIGTLEADFNATIAFLDRADHLTIYVSVKNRTNTMGGQDWPKAIAAMENVAISDKNRTGPYLCVFGIAMEKGLRLIKVIGKSNNPHSHNTEIWKSDFFWPFFTNCSYNTIVNSVLNILIETQKPETLDMTVPEELIKSFGERCHKFGLLDEHGIFDDPFKLVRLFCGVQE